jgi:hypothetical protein
MRNLIYKSMLLSLAIFVFSCDSDDDDNNMVDPIVAPSSYDFTRDGETSVIYSGQTTRLAQSEQLYDALNALTSVEDLDMMFNGGSDGNSAGFADDPSGIELNGTSKKIGNKTSSSTLRGDAILKSQFDAWITEYATDVAPAVANGDEFVPMTAAPGALGGYQLNAMGQELDQLFFKSLIGAFTLDQIVNNYIHPNQLDSGSRIDDNDNDVLSGDNNYTDMEHKWDEGFGYLYGRYDEDLDTAGSQPSGATDLLMKYFKKVNDNFEPGIADEVYNAFIAGRTAIVNKDYNERDAQADIIQVALSKVIGYYAIYYMNDYAAKLTSGNIAGAHHSLSEAWGFLFSLMYTNDGNDEIFMIDGGVPTLAHFLGVDLIPGAPEYMSNFHTMQPIYLTAPYNESNPGQSGMIALVKKAFADKGVTLNID